MRASIFFIALAAMFGLTHCVSTGTKVTDETIAKIKFGSTTKAELLALLGEPQSKMDTTNTGNYYSKACGEKDAALLALTYTSTKSGIGSASIEMVSFLITPAGIVCHKSGISNSQSAF